MLALVKNNYLKIERYNSHNLPKLGFIKPSQLGQVDIERDLNLTAI